MVWNSKRGLEAFVVVKNFNEQYAKTWQLIYIASSSITKKLLEC